MDLVPGGVRKACHRATYNEDATRWEQRPNWRTGKYHQWSMATGGLVFHAEGFGPGEPNLGNSSYHYSFGDIRTQAERKRMITTLDPQIFISEDSVQRGPSLKELFLSSHHTKVWPGMDCGCILETTDLGFYAGRRLNDKSGGGRTAAASAESKEALLFPRAATALRPRPQRFVRGPTCRCCPKARSFTALALEGQRPESRFGGGVQVADIADVQGRKAVQEIDSTDPPQSTYVTKSANSPLEITTGALSAAQQVSVFLRSITPRGSRLNKCLKMVSQRSPWLLAAACTVWAVTAGAQTIIVDNKTVGKPRHSRRRVRSRKANRADHSLFQPPMSPTFTRSCAVRATATRASTRSS